MQVKQHQASEKSSLLSVLASWCEEGGRDSDTWNAIGVAVGKKMKNPLSFACYHSPKTA
jgi:hypothetical protein